jgi:hypothetical protein
MHIFSAHLLCTFATLKADPSGPKMDSLGTLPALRCNVCAANVHFSASCPALPLAVPVRPHMGRGRCCSAAPPCRRHCPCGHAGDTACAAPPRQHCCCSQCSDTAASVHAAIAETLHAVAAVSQQQHRRGINKEGTLQKAICAASDLIVPELARRQCFFLFSSMSYSLIGVDSAIALNI